ncbi:MAG: thioredoxin fold domain-containing protein [Phycisphaerales bacterium]|nr:thioredoxin fold domain-containing protein [Phycisphaerales bacterium]
MENNKDETPVKDYSSESSRSRPSGGGHRFVLLILAVFALIYWYSSRPSAPPGPAVELSTALAQAVEQNKPVLLKFQAVWCPPCHWMNKEVFAQTDVQQALADWVVLDVDVDTNRDLVAVYRVSGPPTYVILSPQGMESGRQEGALPATELLTFMQAVRAKIQPAP